MHRNPNRIIAALAGLALIPAAAGCTPPKPGPVRTPSVDVLSADPARVRDLCDFFAYRSLETLSEPAAQGNVDLLAERPGVPYNLAKTAHDYYADGITAPDTAEHRNTLTTRYETVLASCRTAGTGWHRP